MAYHACVHRLQKEFKSICKDPVPQVVARPSPNNILEWHYVLEGSEGTPFAGGVYHGKVKFPPEYPFKPPAISMITPNGRFATHKRICMSMSDFHPETWDPLWSVSSILAGLLSFMMDNTPTTGSVSTTSEEKRLLAQASLAFNCKSPTFRKMFPEYVDKYMQQQKIVDNNSLQQGEGKTKDRAAHKPVMLGDVAVASGPEMENLNVGKQKTLKSKLPVWVTPLLLAIFASIMALPLLTMDFSQL